MKEHNNVNVRSITEIIFSLNSLPSKRAAPTLSPILFCVLLITRMILSICRAAFTFQSTYAFRHPFGIYKRSTREEREAIALFSFGKRDQHLEDTRPEKRVKSHQGTVGLSSSVPPASLCLQDGITCCGLYSPRSRGRQR